MRFQVIAIVATALICPMGAQSTEPVSSAASQCSALATRSIPASAIALPSKGARVTSATLIAPGNPGGFAMPEYCKVLAEILPVDPAAQPVKMQLNLPSNWNGKAFQLGGGGYDGNVISGTGPVPGGAGTVPPLARGYATFGGDGGHSGDPTAAFLNDETLDNYMGAHLKKAHDVAVELIRTRYGAVPKKTYFAGGSGGGREAFYAMQRQTQDYDGIISFYPAWPLNEMLLNYGRIWKALASPGGYSNAAKQALVYRKVLESCDTLDGAADGIVSNTDACHFEIGTLRCPEGADAGDTCLSDVQIAAFRTIAEPMKLPYAVASGESIYPGYNILKGADPKDALGSGPSQSFSSLIYDTYSRGWVMRNLNVRALQIDPLAPGEFRERISKLSIAADMDKVDLDDFRKRGGKLLMVHGKSDDTIPTASSADYWTRLQEKMGAAVVKEFARYYEVPGYAHGNGVFTVSWDSVTVLENWVEKGVAPVGQIATDRSAATSGRTRPLCEYPTWPRYDGKGDINSAASFSCVRN